MKLMQQNCIICLYTSDNLRKKLGLSDQVFLLKIQKKSFQQSHFGFHSRKFQKKFVVTTQRIKTGPGGLKIFGGGAENGSECWVLIFLK